MQFSSWSALWNDAKEFDFPFQTSVLGALGLCCHVSYSLLSYQEKSVSLSTISRRLRVSGCLSLLGSFRFRRIPSKCHSQERAGFFICSMSAWNTWIHHFPRKKTSHSINAAHQAGFPGLSVQLNFWNLVQEFIFKAGENLMIPNHFESSQYCFLRVTSARLPCSSL